MRFFTSALLICLSTYIFSGCQQSEFVEHAEVVRETAESSRIQPKDPAAMRSAIQEQENEKPSRADRLFNKAGDMFKKATESTAEGTTVTKDWILDKIQEAAGENGFVPDDPSEWASKMFESLKDKGLTGAGDASEWLTEDIRNMDAYKYKVVKVSLDDLEALEDQLNHFGQLKWECYHVAERGTDTIMFFKKQRNSMLRNVPFTGMMKLVPLMGRGE